SLSISFFNDPPPPEIYTLSLHDALPISHQRGGGQKLLIHGIRNHPARRRPPGAPSPRCARASPTRGARRSGDRDRSGRRSVRWRSEEHTSELQSRFDLVCRLLLEKKKTK